MIDVHSHFFSYPGHFTDDFREQARRARGDGKEVDLGFVGEAEEVNPDPVRAALEAGGVPVISPLGALVTGEPMNINADVSAAAS